MLVFFIHGVATRDVKYSHSLIDGIKKEFNQENKKLPYFYSSFWGHVLNDFNKIWNYIDEDLNSLEKKYSVSSKDSFRYRQFREGLISEFTGDMFTYMNEKQGFEVRKLIADQLTKFIEKHPEEKEIHIVAHSLGTVILWDILFSDKFKEGDPAFLIRGKISDRGVEDNDGQASLASITTMGSPILFFNAMLGINAEDIERKIQSYTAKTIKWVNIVHASDVISYPLSASLNLQKERDSLIFRDFFIYKDANLLETAARKVNQEEIALLAGIVDAHTSYWSLPEVAQVIFEQMFVKDFVKLRNIDDVAKEVVRRLKKVPGMSRPGVKLHSKEYIVEQIEFYDGSGCLDCIKNFANVHHVYVYNSQSTCIFAGYVDWLRTNDLLDEVDRIRARFEMP